MSPEYEHKNPGQEHQQGAHAATIIKELGVEGRELMATTNAQQAWGSREGARFDVFGLATLN